MPFFLFSSESLKNPSPVVFLRIIFRPTLHIFMSKGFSIGLKDILLAIPSCNAVDICPTIKFGFFSSSSSLRFENSESNQIRNFVKLLQFHDSRCIKTSSILQKSLSQLSGLGSNLKIGNQFSFGNLPHNHTTCMCCK